MALYLVSYCYIIEQILILSAPVHDIYIRYTRVSFDTGKISIIRIQLLIDLYPRYHSLSIYESPILGFMRVYERIRALFM